MKQIHVPEVRARSLKFFNRAIHLLHKPGQPCLTGYLNSLTNVAPNFGILPKRVERKVLISCLGSYYLTLNPGKCKTLLSSYFDAVLNCISKSPSISIQAGMKNSIE